MSGVPSEDQSTIREICALFTEAEHAIKEVEDSGGELIVPAVNQLRYTGNHLVRYLSDPGVEAARDELDDAIKHCKRATYDAYEAAILNQLMEFKNSRTTIERLKLPQSFLIIPISPQKRRELDNLPAIIIKEKPGANNTMPPKITCASLLTMSASLMPVVMS